MRIAIAACLLALGCAEIIQVPDFTPAPDASTDDATDGAADEPVVPDGGCTSTGVSPYFLYKQTPNGQVLTTWSSFVVEVVDVNLQPIPNIRVIFAEPTVDPRFWVGASSANGTISATQFALTAGMQTETAALVDPSWTGQNGFGAGCVPTVAPTMSGADLATQVSWMFTQE